MENENPVPQYDPYQQRSDCNRTMIYCIVSIALLITSGAISHPDVISMIPGGEYTASFLRIIIVLVVLLLCVWQRPRTSM